jgi:hypothetical protein
MDLRATDYPGKGLLANFFSNIPANLRKPLDTSQMDNGILYALSGGKAGSREGVMDAAGGMVSPLGLLGTIAGRGAKTATKPWQMTKAQYDTPATLKKTDTFYIPVGKDKVEVVLNPTSSDFRAMKKEARAAGFVDERDPPLRFTEDAEGNKYYWKSYQGVHPTIEGPLSKIVGTELNQNMGSKGSHRNVIRRALYEGEQVPKHVLAEYPGLIEEVSKIPGSRIAGGG